MNNVSERHRSRSWAQRGQGLAELAILLPVWLLLVVGVLDLARVYNAYTALQNVARVGARYGAVHPLDTTGIQNVAVREAQTTGMAIETSDITVSCPAGACTPGNPIRVSATYDASLYTIYIVGLHQITLSASVQFMVM